MIYPITFGLKKTGLPLIIVQLFDENICLLLDTGATNNIIDKRVYEHFKDEIKTLETTSSIIGLQGEIKENMTIELPFSFENTNYLEPFTCTEDIVGFEAVKKEIGTSIHGILGTYFFIKHNWIIDFDKMEVYSTAEQNV